MAEEEAPDESEDDAPKKGGKGMLFGLVGAVVLGGAGFAAVYLGFVGGSSEAEPEMAEIAPLPTVNFIEMDNIIVSLGKNASARHLQFRGHLEIDPMYREDVTLLLPRVYDVLNTFLRAVDEEEIARPSSLIKLRAQMLRRIQIVTGEGRVRDLLISEFLLN